MSAIPEDPPYKTPPFDPGTYAAKTFAWWSWHPANLQHLASGWRRTCWEAPTEERAMDLIPHLQGNEHCKLIAEGFGDLVEVYDLPPRNPGQWLEYRDTLAATKKAALARAELGIKELDKRQVLP